MSVSYRSLHSKVLLTSTMHAFSRIQNVTEGKIYFIQISDVNTTHALTFTSFFHSNNSSLSEKEQAVFNVVYVFTCVCVFIPFKCFLQFSFKQKWMEVKFCWFLVTKENFLQPQNWVNLMKSLCKHHESFHFNCLYWKFT